MTGDSYTQRGAERGLNAIAGEDDAVQTLSHHHTHHSSNSDVNDPSGDAQSTTAPQCSSYYSNASAPGPSSLVPSAVTSAAAVVLRSPTIKAPRIVSSEYTSTAPSADGTATAAAPSGDGGELGQRHAKLTYYRAGDDLGDASAASLQHSRLSGVGCDSSAPPCAPSFCVDGTNNGGSSSSSSSTSGSSRHRGVPAAPRFQLQPPPAARRRRAADSQSQYARYIKNQAASADKKGNNAHAMDFVNLRDSSSCIAKVSMATPARPSPVESGQQSRADGSSEYSAPSSSSSASSEASNCWYSQAHVHAAQAQIQASFVALQRRGVRLRRSCSLPNMKTKPTMDLASPASHKLIMPPRVTIRDPHLLSATRQLQKGVHVEDAHGRAASPLHVSNNQGQQHMHYQYLRRLNGMAQSNSQQVHADADAQQHSSRRAPLPAHVETPSLKQIYIPSLQPPITRQTLKELDLHEILKNPQLRHDVVYDSNVQFRPNFDGERGRRKRDFGNKYWLAVQREIETGCTCTAFVDKTILPCICESTRQQRPAAQATLQGSTLQTRKASPLTSCFPASAVLLPNAKGQTDRSRMPSRLPALIFELRAICLSVLPVTGTSEDSLASLRSAGSTPTKTFSEQAKDGDRNKIAEEQAQKSPSNAPSRPTAKPAPAPSNASSSSLQANGAIASPSLGSMAWGTDHHSMIAQTLDPYLLTQQLQHGKPDVAGLVSFVGSILKLHCAPMRDELIESMISTVCYGDVAHGLRLCFEVLELMKLDIANHQLRSSRTYLVETAAEFETRWFREQMEGKSLFERTLRWYSKALSKQNESSADAHALHSQSKTEFISSAFDDGFLSLVFEPPNAALLATPGRLATNLSLMSNASLNHACTGVYPETFQFDAFRLLAFHGDVSDITIVYMLLLLFRQLACSSQNLSKQALPSSSLPPSAIVENASSLAASRLDAIKGEIWTLLNEAELELISASRSVGNSPTTPSTPTTPMQPRTPATPPGIAGRVLVGSMWPGRSKFDNPRWRRAVGDIVLQIASRAIQVQLQARKGLQDGSEIEPSAPDESMPSDATMALLVQWMDRNLRADSSLHRLCSSRLRRILAAQTTVSCAPSGGHAINGAPCSRTRKQNPTDEDAQELVRKRIRLQTGKAASATSASAQQMSATSATSNSSNDAAAPPIRDDSLHSLERAAGLEPLAGEIRVLAERMLKVKMLHLRVFRPVYERIAAEFLQWWQRQPPKQAQTEQPTQQQPST